MSHQKTSITSGKLFPILFHVVLWTIWIGLPIVNAGDNERMRTFFIWLIPVSLMHIPLFLLNTEWLIPQTLRKNRTSAYLLSLVLLIGCFSVVQYFMKEWVIPAEIRFNRNSIYWSVIPVVFVTAISTGYGFIRFLIYQEKIQQEERAERLRSELSFLRSQISPHFIFNVLNSIVYLIRSKSDMAEPVTLKLSELMRYMLYSPPDGQVPLQHEVQYLSNYIALQRIRFEEDVTVDFQIEGDPNPYSIEPMILIPFVENAFKHGIGMLNNPTIQVRLSIRDTQLHFEVHNKVAPETVNPKDVHSGIGIPNVKRRLELLYPEAHSLEIASKADSYQVFLTLDLHLQPSGKDSGIIPSQHEATVYSR